MRNREESDGAIAIVGQITRGSVVVDATPCYLVDYNSSHFLPIGTYGLLIGYPVFRVVDTYFTHIALEVNAEMTVKIIILNADR